MAFVIESFTEAIDRDRDYLAFNPTYDQMNDQLGEMSRQLGRKYRRVRSSFPALMLEMSSYAHLLRFIHARREEWSSGWHLVA